MEYVNARKNIAHMDELELPDKVKETFDEMETEFNNKLSALETSLKSWTSQNFIPKE